MVGTEAHFKCLKKPLSKIEIYLLAGCYYKFNTVASAQIKYLGNVKLRFNTTKFVRQIFLANHQLSQFFQFNLFMRKSNYF